MTSYCVVSFEHRSTGSRCSRNNSEIAMLVTFKPEIRLFIIAFCKHQWTCFEYLENKFRRSCDKTIKFASRHQNNQAEGLGLSQTRMGPSLCKIMLQPQLLKLSRQITISKHVKAFLLGLQVSSIHSLTMQCSAIMIIFWSSSYR